MTRMRLLVILVLGAALGCVDDEGPLVRASAADSPDSPDSIGSEVEDVLRCPPCGMRMDPGTPLRKIAGHSWAVCNERCAELIAEEPQLFLELAVD